MSISKEHVSALMDNQGSSELIHDVYQDHESLETWSRYHLIGDVLRNEQTKSPSLEKTISLNIFAALEQEAVYSEQPIHQPVHASNVVSLQSRLKKSLSTIGQYGIAASVAIGVMVGVQQWQSSQNSPDVVPHPVLNTIPVSGSAAPVSINLNNERMNVLPQQQMTEQQLQQERQQMAKYIHDHQLQQRLTIQR